MVRIQAQILNDAGRLPPPPEGHEDLFEKMEIAIDPHQSLIAMPEALSMIGELFAELSYDVLHNDSGVPFLTSDNPVIYFDPRIPDRQMLPYTVRLPEGPIELLFPVTPWMVLGGRSRPYRRDIAHKTVSQRQAVNRINRLISRFAYRTVFASSTGSERVVNENASVSPVPRFDRVAAPRAGSDQSASYPAAAK